MHKGNKRRLRYDRILLVVLIPVFIITYTVTFYKHSERYNELQEEVTGLYQVEQVDNLYEQIDDLMEQRDALQEKIDRYEESEDSGESVSLDIPTECPVVTRTTSRHIS